MRRRGPLVALAASLLLAGCAAHARKVLIVGVDGLRADQLAQAETPTLDALAATGALRLDATNAWTPEEPFNGHSATNWGVLLTGVAPAESGLTANGDDEHFIDDDAEPGSKTRVATLFGWIKAFDPQKETGAFHTWAGIGLERGTILGNARSAVDLHFSSRADRPSAERDRETLDATVEALLGRGRFSRADPDVVFVHLSAVDAAGHAHTYDDPVYRASIEAVDALIAELLAALAQRPSRPREDWLVLLSTDHGGPADEMGHADNSDPAVHTIPFLVSGDGVLPQHWDLAGVTLYDVTPTVLDWMGVEVPRGALAGRSRVPGTEADSEPAP